MKILIEIQVPWTLDTYVETPCIFRKYYYPELGKFNGTYIPFRKIDKRERERETEREVRDGRERERGDRNGKTNCFQKTKGGRWQTDLAK